MTYLKKKKNLKPLCGFELSTSGFMGSTKVILPVNYVRFLLLIYSGSWNYWFCSYRCLFSTPCAVQTLWVLPVSVEEKRESRPLVCCSILWISTGYFVILWVTSKMHSGIPSRRTILLLIFFWKNMNKMCVGETCSPNRWVSWETEPQMSKKHIFKQWIIWTTRGV